ncbi:hypothetical protein HBA54_24620 [Pelagibius litoralis]|uniref:Uncharacterized protein n=1 Tax=Pelagibius litoralis TaxID=374515 RepID=A0A967F280_9PROT|nr:hypothetical protein [Pelagibius litoralis]NIA71784.1 hypothetical protein [Pelagibius litoralis]
MQEKTPARMALISLALASPLCLGGCVTGLVGAAGMALNAVTGGSGATASKAGSPGGQGAFDGNSPRELQDALAQTDDSTSPLCRRRLEAYRQKHAATEDEAQGEVQTVSKPGRRCGLQPLCLPGAERPTEMMVCRSQ